MERPSPGTILQLENGKIKQHQGKKKKNQNQCLFLNQRTENNVLQKQVSWLRASVSLLGQKQPPQLTGQTMLYEFSLEAIALQKEHFLQVLNKALLFKQNLIAMNVQGTFSVKLQVLQKHAGQLHHAGQCRKYNSE